ncbi:MAG: DUF58 domain-containing protein [Myxococcota bacterium]|nr:DUF58 domain-containing protein [Myxococcota bacterium]
MSDTNSNFQEVLSPELFAKIKAIQIRTQRLVTDSLAGDYESAFKGRGMEFEEVRAYIPGDDVRTIDWKVTARTGQPFVKVYREERELTVMLLVDVSSSGAFGSGNRFKSEIAAEIAAILAYAAIKKNDRVGLIIFSDRIEHYVPPKKGRGHVWMVIRDILTFKPERRSTNIDVALDFLGKVVRRRSVTFLLSDFMDFTASDQLRIASKRHDLTAINVRDPREGKFPNIGFIELEDAETGETILLDTSDPDTQREITRVTGLRSRKLKTDLQKMSVGQIQIKTNESYVDPIVQYFRHR